MFVTLYKAVPQKFLDGIKKDGLDPMKAGQHGGTAAKAGAAVFGDTGRRLNPRFDKNITWLANHYLAQDYAFGALDGTDPVMLRVTVEANAVKYKSATAGWYTRLPIPPHSIWFQAGRDLWEQIAAYDGSA
jgi:hypothetical protein